MAVNTIKAGALALWLGLTLVLSACGGGGGDDATATPPTDPNSAAVTLDAAGGQVATPSGVKLSVPASALAAGTTLRIASDSTGAPPLPTGTGLRAVGDMLAMTPHGSTFNSEVTLLQRQA